MPDQFDLLQRMRRQTRLMEASVQERDVENRLERTAVREMAVDPRWEPVMRRMNDERGMYARSVEDLVQRLSQTFLSPEMYGEMMTKLAYARGALSALDAIVGYVLACTREET